MTSHLHIAMVAFALQGQCCNRLYNPQNQKYFLNSLLPKQFSDLLDDLHTINQLDLTI